MKIRSAILAGMVAIVVIGIVSAFYESDQGIHENKIRVAYFPNIGHAVPIIGYESGIFGDGLGNKTFIEIKIFDSGPQVIESIFARSIDLAYVGPVPAINGFLKSDHEMIILSGAASGGASFIVHPNSEINTAEDFSGKKIAAPQIGNTQDVSLQNYLMENGLAPVQKGGSVVIFNIAIPDIYTLFVKGEIDGAWVPEPWATIFVQQLDGKRLFYEEDLWPNKEFASVLLIGRTDYIEKNPEIIQKWIESHDKTVNWINTNPKKSELIFNEFMKKTLGEPLPDAIVSESLSNIKITSDPIPESIAIFAQRADSLGYLGRNGYDLQGIFYDSNSSEDPI
jgi:NitT/TauT family transport system substrate-binding protein